MSIEDLQLEKSRKLKEFCGKRYGCDGCPLDDWHSCFFYGFDEDELDKAISLVYDENGAIKPEALSTVYKFKTIGELINVLYNLNSNQAISDEAGNTMRCVIVSDDKVTITYT